MRMLTRLLTVNKRTSIQKGKPTDRQTDRQTARQTISLIMIQASRNETPCRNGASSNPKRLQYRSIEVAIAIAFFLRPRRYLRFLKRHLPSSAHVQSFSLFG